MTGLSEAQYQQRLANVRKIADERHGATHCKRGHPFNKKNTYTDKNGKRYCRVCKSLRYKPKKRLKGIVIVAP